MTPFQQKHQFHQTVKHRSAVTTATNRAFPHMPARTGYFWPTVIGLVMAAILIAASSGCIPRRLPLADAPTTKSVLPQHVPASLQAASKSLNWVVVLAVVGIGIGTTAYFIIPGDHKLAFGVIFGSIAMGGTALIVQTSLPFLPWIFALTATLGLIWLIARVLRKPGEAKV